MKLTIQAERLRIFWGHRAFNMAHLDASNKGWMPTMCSQINGSDVIKQHRLWKTKVFS